MDIYNCNCIVPQITQTRLTKFLIKYYCCSCGKKLTIVYSEKNNLEYIEKIKTNCNELANI